MRQESQKQNQRKYASEIILVFLILLAFTYCRKPADDLCCLTLQEFEVIDPLFRSLIDRVRDSVIIKDRYKNESIPVIELREKDSILEFGFVSAGKNNLSEMYIFMNNKRIVGYMDIEKDTFIVLSNVVSRFDFYNIFYSYIIPTENKHQFDYVYFPDDLYLPVSYKGMPPPPNFFDPYYYWYTYTGGKYIYQENYHDLKK